MCVYVYFNACCLDLGASPWMSPDITVATKHCGCY